MSLHFLTYFQPYSRLWPLIVGNEKLIRVMLQMLLSFTKNNVACATAISSSNLISSIVKQFQYYEKQIRNKVKASPIFTLNFNLLCNLSCSQEARAFFWKGTLILQNLTSATCLKKQADNRFFFLSSRSRQVSIDRLVEGRFSTETCLTFELMNKNTCLLFRQVATGRLLSRE